MNRRPTGCTPSLPAPAIGSARLALFLAVLAILPYTNAVTAGFTLDDQPQIRENAAVIGSVDLLKILSSPLFPGDLYRPLTMFTFAVNEKLTPGTPASFHATNVALHALTTVLVFAVARQLFQTSIAGVAAALFAVHPIHTEAVTSLVGRAEILAALFGLLSLLSAAGAMTARRWVQRAVLQAVSLTAFSLALLSKESALTVLPLIVLFRITCRGEPWGHGLHHELRSLEWLPYTLCAGVFLWLRFYVVGAVTPPLPIKPLNNMLAFAAWDVRIPSAIAILWDYFGLLNVPLVLAADYSYDQVPLVTSWREPRLVAGVALIAAALVLMTPHRRAAVRFTAAFPFVTLALTANVLFPIGTIKAERLLYFPSVGWLLLAAYGIDRMAAIPGRRRMVALALAFVIVAFAIRTWERNWDWRDDLALYRSLARAAPDSAKSRHDLGVVFEREDLHQAAIAQFERALAVYPYPESAFGVGLSYDKLGRIDDAVRWYKKTLAIAPDFHKAHTNLCSLLWSNKRFDEAIRACREGLRYAPTDGNVLKMLGFSLIGAGATNKGAEVLRRSLVVGGPDDELLQYLAQLASAPSSAAADQNPPQ